ncbi:uncharacterized protein B0J16DRAFT_331467 [Fusarium flagelliforme]|uniref:uncharacterized protein n=1 Tax=Fusarium flagelliforme TaxID=2675880 RepID=UPI001E8CB78F|nr:uncharacterized protein B0J16DRAFT_331467 [Fusarium flagelliforme]KAH7198999.1 hypothetical protein B0J16DRAFT_331467 [Fusarium flagelliforme]
MQFSTVLSAIAFATGAHAWAQAGNGEWIANNQPYGPMPYSGGAINAWEACTYYGSNALVPAGHGCRYWTNAQGGIFSGTCRDTPGHVITTRNCQ